jgi:hypothetical protein
MGDMVMMTDQFVCCICNVDCIGYSHNAWPLKEGQCCGFCNIAVIAARIRKMQEKVKQSKPDAD